MSLASPLRKVASKLMLRFGGIVTMRRVEAGVYSAVSGTITETTTDTAIRGVLESVNLREASDLIQAGDKRLIVAAADTAAVPTTADRVVITNVVHQVIQVVTIEQDNEPITYELILRV
jgi:hypothetical protein